jgi:hypothetical protein
MASAALLTTTAVPRVPTARANLTLLCMTAPPRASDG